MSALKNDLFIRALLKQEVERTPMWIMRQAGRYLPEYRATRKRAGNFLTLCKTPELACEVTMQPLDRYGLDAAILFSDILTIPDALGLGLQFSEGEGPSFKSPITSMADVNRIADISSPINDLSYVTDAVSLIRKELDGRVPLIGFSGSPWTLATYMVEGKGSKEFHKVKGMLYQEPETLEKLLDVLSKSVTEYLAAQIDAGAQAVMIFDTWGGVLSKECYLKYSLSPMQKIVHQLKNIPSAKNVPIVLFTKGGGNWLNEMAATGCDALGLDWTTEIDHARAQVGNKVALQGNLDPCVLYGSDDVIREEVKKVLSKFGNGSGHVLNLGHGIQQYVNPDKVSVLVEAVKEFSPAYH
ncbi:MAG: uroporphyrinogen decarboxylase [Gammaproteobacteria bacterium]|nr:MAG: uroporphyrinogen decarboxylase [Gammaproteobacteria bacterium]